MSVSGHKIGAPKGMVRVVGFPACSPPLTFGGGQEAGHASGHQGRAEYCRICQGVRDSHGAFRRRLRPCAGVGRLPQAAGQRQACRMPPSTAKAISRMLSIFPCPAARARSCCMYRGGRGLHFQRLSLLQGQQSGCSRHSVSPKARTDSALRVSFAPFNTKEDVDAFVAAVEKGAKMFRR